MMTRITGLLLHADGEPANGTAVISWIAFQIHEIVIVGGQKLVEIIDGNFSVDLYPNVTAHPRGMYYTVRMELDNGAVYEEFWIVPDTQSATVEQVRSTFPLEPGMAINPMQIAGSGAEAGMILAYNGSYWVPGHVTVENVNPNWIQLDVGSAGDDFWIDGSPVQLGRIATFNIPSASLTARGLVTTGAQSFAGNKTFAGNVLIQGSITGPTITDIYSQINGKVPVTRQIIAGTGMGGGGTLAADVTLTADVVSVNGQVGDVVISPSSIGGVPATRQVIAGLGLVGGGALSADVTLAANIPAIQTPWKQNINGAGFSLSGVREVHTELAFIDLMVTWANYLGTQGNFTVWADRDVLKFAQDNTVAPPLRDEAEPRAATVMLEFNSLSTPLGMATFNGQVYSKNAGYKFPDGTVQMTAAPTVGGHVIQDEGAARTQRAALNFVGDGVSVTDDAANNRSTVSITGGGAGSQTPWLTDIDASTWRLLNAGNIGIGVAVPTARLHVRDGVSPALLLESSAAASDGNSLCGITFSSHDQSAYAVGATINTRANGAWTSVNHGTDIVFRGVSGGATALIEWVRFRNGNVGIKTSTPTATLDVNGFMRVTDVTGVATSGTGVEIMYTPGSQGYINSYDRGVGAYRVLAINASTLCLNSAGGGKVGINAAPANVSNILTVYESQADATGSDATQPNTIRRGLMVQGVFASHDGACIQMGAAGQVGWHIKHACYNGQEGPLSFYGASVAGGNMQRVLQLSLGGATLWGNMNITGEYQVSGTNIKGAMQTPWLSNIDAANFNLSNLQQLHFQGIAPTVGWDTNTRIWSQSGYGARFDAHQFEFDVSTAGFARMSAMTIAVGGIVTIYNYTSCPEFRTGGSKLLSDHMEIGGLLTGDRWSYIDFHSSGTPETLDFSARIGRQPGVNGIFYMLNTGAGSLNLENPGGAIQFWSAGASFNSRVSIVRASPSSDWGGTNLEIQSSGSFGPRIAFHYAGIGIAHQFGMDSAGTFTCYDNPGTGYAPFRAWNVYAANWVIATGNVQGATFNGFAIQGDAVYPAANNILKVGSNGLTYVSDMYSNGNLHCGAVFLTGHINTPANVITSETVTHVAIQVGENWLRWQSKAAFDSQLAAPWAGITGRPAWLATATLTTAPGTYNDPLPSGFYDGAGAVGAPLGSAAWSGIINCSHSNTSVWGWQIGIDNWQAGEAARFAFRSRDGAANWASWKQVVLNNSSFDFTMTGAITHNYHGASAGLHIVGLANQNAGLGLLRVTAQDVTASTLLCSFGCLGSVVRFQISASGTVWMHLGGVLKVLSVDASGFVKAT